MKYYLLSNHFDYGMPRFTLCKVKNIKVFKEEMNQSYYDLILNISLKQYKQLQKDFKIPKIHDR